MRQDPNLAAGKKNAAGWPREYSQTPSDEGNKQL